MTKKLVIVLAMLAMASIVSANSFTADGIVLDGNYGYNFNDTRELVPDGSFEAGCNATWSCATDVTCDWITDLVPLGLWNYDGMMVAWLGGYCGTAVCWTDICQTLDFTGTDLSFWWNAYIGYGELAQFPPTWYVRVGGDDVFVL